MVMYVLAIHILYDPQEIYFNKETQEIRWDKYMGGFLVRSYSISPN